ncbi:MAG: hypothetical protein AAF602_17105, partial [Myxococcota bacterium]
PWPFDHFRGLALVPLAAAGLLAIGASTLLLLPGDPALVIDEATFITLDETFPAEGSERPRDVAELGGSESGGGRVAAVDRPLFRPDVPPAPRRLPLRPTGYTQPPPGGPLQYEAVSAARRRDCPKALESVQKGVREVSLDHATLYRGTWLCFNEAHQRKLELAEAFTWADFAYLLQHFEGPPEAMRDASVRERDRTRVPRWYRDPVGGIEFRLWHYADDEQMAEIVHGLFGGASVADHLATDVYLEALAAVGLSRVPPVDRTPALVDSWARRVYVTTWALGSRPGQAIATHRGQLLPELRRLIDEATAPPPGTDWPVPEPVRQARAVGEGHAAVPRSPAYDGGASKVIEDELTTFDAERTKIDGLR